MSKRIVRLSHGLLVLVVILQLSTAVILYSRSDKPECVATRDTVVLCRLPVDTHGLLDKLKLSANFNYQTYAKGREKHGDAIERYSEQYGLDADLVSAIVTLESGWDERAISEKQAIGLMQVRGGSFAPNENIMQGCSIMAACMKANKNNTLMAVTAYNTGVAEAERLGKPNEFAYKVIKLWYILTIMENKKNGKG